MNERLKLLRKTLDLSQEKLGEKLGVTKTAVSKMELGTYKITDSMIKLICREFNVDYLWLTQGEGEMFMDQDEDVLLTIDKIMLGENEFHKNVMKMAASFDDEDLKALERLIDKYFDIKKAD